MLVFPQHFLRVQAGVWGVHAGLVPAVPRHPYRLGRAIFLFPSIGKRVGDCLPCNNRIMSSFIKAGWKLPVISRDLTEEVEFSCSQPYPSVVLSFWFPCAIHVACYFWHTVDFDLGIFGEGMSAWHMLSCQFVRYTLLKLMRLSTKTLVTKFYLAKILKTSKPYRM